jgi:hypothetical protein
MTTKLRNTNYTNKKAIGWDIGIKNLAYCVLEQTLSIPTVPTTSSNDFFIFNNHQYLIPHWADISLLSQVSSNLANAGQASSFNNTSTLLTCCASKTDKLNSPICGVTATYCSETLSVSGNYQGYCKNHYKKLGSPRMPLVNVSKCYYQLSSTTANAGCCNSKAVNVLSKHIYKGFCKKHTTEMIKSNAYTETDFLKINNIKNAGKINIDQLGIALFQELDKIKPQILEPDVILLENQPVLKNPTMKSMQMFLYSYYLMRIMEMNGDNIGKSALNEKYIQCYTASKKLDLIQFFPKSEQTRINALLEKVKNSYQRNKKMSIYMVEYLLQETPSWLEFFKKHPKQDDLADSLLMTLHYFERNALIKLNKQNKESNQSNDIKNLEKDLQTLE